MRKTLLTLALAAAGAAGVSRAHACSVPGPQALAIDGTHVGAAPGAVGEVTYTVTRGKGPKGSGCGSVSESSCDDIGGVALHFKASVDPDSDRRAVGYRVRLVSGVVPTGVPIIAEPMLPFFDDAAATEATIYFHWSDGETDDQERIDFSITLTPVDANGNEGPTSPVVRVVNDGDGGGCSVRGGPAGSAFVPLAALAMIVARRFARRTSPPFPKTSRPCPRPPRTPSAQCRLGSTSRM
jgi:MYXO-CTERM domain-containing protein